MPTLYISSHLIVCLQTVADMLRDDYLVQTPSGLQPRYYSSQPIWLDYNNARVRGDFGILSRSSFPSTEGILSGNPPYLAQLMTFLSTCAGSDGWAARREDAGELAACAKLLSERPSAEHWSVEAAQLPPYSDVTPYTGRFTFPAAVAGTKARNFELSATEKDAKERVKTIQTTLELERKSNADLFTKLEVEKRSRARDENRIKTLEASLSAEQKAKVEAEAAKVTAEEALKRAQIELDASRAEAAKAIKKAQDDLAAARQAQEQASKEARAAKAPTTERKAQAELKKIQEPIAALEYSQKIQTLGQALEILSTIDGATPAVGLIGVAMAKISGPQAMEALIPLSQVRVMLSSNPNVPPAVTESLSAVIASLCLGTSSPSSSANFASPQKFAYEISPPPVKSLTDSSSRAAMYERLIAAINVLEDLPESSEESNIAMAHLKEASSAIFDGDLQTAKEYLKLAIAKIISSHPELEGILQEMQTVLQQCESMATVVAIAPTQVGMPFESGSSSSSPSSASSSSSSSSAPKGLLSDGLPSLGATYKFNQISLVLASMLSASEASSAKTMEPIKIVLGAENSVALDSLATGLFSAKTLILPMELSSKDGSHWVLLIIDSASGTVKLLDTENSHEAAVKSFLSHSLLSTWQFSSIDIGHQQYSDSCGVEGISKVIAYLQNTTAIDPASAAVVQSVTYFDYLIGALSSIFNIDQFHRVKDYLMEQWNKAINFALDTNNTALAMDLIAQGESIPGMKPLPLRGAPFKPDHDDQNNDGYFGGNNHDSNGMSNHGFAPLTGCNTTNHTDTEGGFS